MLKSTQYHEMNLYLLPLGLINQLQLMCSVHMQVAPYTLHSPSELNSISTYSFGSHLEKKSDGTHMEEQILRNLAFKSFD